MNSPTGADDAQVQDDAKRRARAMMGFAISADVKPQELEEMIASALHEAEQRGMRRAAEIARGFIVDDGVTNCAPAINIANAIERASKEGK